MNEWNSLIFQVVSKICCLNVLFCMCAPFKRDPIGKEWVIHLTQNSAFVKTNKPKYKVEDKCTETLARCAARWLRWWLCLHPPTTHTQAESQNKGPLRSEFCKPTLMKWQFTSLRVTGCLPGASAALYPQMASPEGLFLYCGLQGTVVEETTASEPLHKVEAWAGGRQAGVGGRLGCASSPACGSFAFVGFAFPGGWPELHCCSRKLLLWQC